MSLIPYNKEFSSIITKLKTMIQSINSASFLNSEIFIWGILPLLIFCARIIDVSIGTVRIIFISRGMKFIAPLLGFFEVIIWLIAIGQIMKNMNNIICYIAYGSGFAMGTYVGMLIEEKLAMGMLAVRIITAKEADALIESLKQARYGITVVDAEGSTGKVKLIFTIIKRKDLNNVAGIINEFDPASFYSVEEIRSATEGIFPRKKIAPLEQSKSSKVV